MENFALAKQHRVYSLKFKWRSLSNHCIDSLDLSSGLVAVSSGVTSAVPPHTPATPLTPMMSPCPPAMTQAIRPENQTITVTLPVTPLATADGIADQRRHWWHIEEVNH